MDKIWQKVNERVIRDKQDGSYEIQKEFNRSLRLAEEKSKPSKCVLCGKPQTSFCKSHSIPRMILSNIAQNGFVYNANELVKLEIFDQEEGIGKSGVFRFICNDCDNKYFKEYEDENNLINFSSNKMLAEIALKNNLILLSKRTIEKEVFENLPVNDEVKDFFLKPIILDSEEYKEEVFFYKNIIDNIDNKENEQGKLFNILFRKILPYKTSIAIQALIAMDVDMEGNEINNRYDYSKNTRMENVHLCVFPFEEETLVLLFSHRRDKKYKKLQHQINSSSEERVLRFINWCIFKYSEYYYISKGALNLDNETLKQLSRENGAYPNLGVVDRETLVRGYNKVKEDEIPNFLLEDVH